MKNETRKHKMEMGLNDFNDIKVRKSWRFNPATKVHSTPKGVRGYKRSDSRHIERHWSSFDE